MQNIQIPNTGVLSGVDLVNDINAGFTSLQNNIAGILTKSVAGGSDITLTASESYYGIIVLTGTITASINVIVPAAAMQWTVYNNTSGAFTITVKTAAGSGVTAPQNSAIALWCNGTNVYQTSITVAEGDFLVQGNTTLGNASSDTVTVNGSTYTFTALATRIKGDFSNSTLANRVMFQNSGANQQTSLGVMPSGSATNSNLLLYASSDPDNATLAFLQQTESVCNVATSKSGTGAFTPMAILVGGSERSRIETTGEQHWAYQGYFVEATLSDNTTIAWDVNTSQVAKVTLGGSRAMGAPSNQKAGAFYSLMVIQDATGNRTLSWNSVYKFPSGSAPTLTTSANAKDLFVFRSDGTNMYLVGKTQDVR